MLNQSILKEINPGISLEGMMLKLKFQYFGHLVRRVDSLEKTDAGRDWGQEEKGTTEDEMAGWHHRLDGRESDLIYFSSVAQLCPTLCDPMNCSMPGLSITNSWSSPKLMSIESVMPSNHLILCHPFLLLPSIFPIIRVLSNELTLASGGQSIGASASVSVLPMNIQD